MSRDSIKRKTFGKNRSLGWVRFKNRQSDLFWVTFLSAVLVTLFCSAVIVKRLDVFSFLYPISNDSNGRSSFYPGTSQRPTVPNSKGPQPLVLATERQLFVEGGGTLESFSEIFSSSERKNIEKSTAYQDSKTLTVSFPLSYEKQEIARLNEDILAAKSNGKEAILVTSANKIFVLNNQENLSEAIPIDGLLKQAQSAVVDYDFSTGKWRVALEAGQEIVFYTFTVGQPLATKVYSFRPSNFGPNLFFSCWAGECLLGDGARIFDFKFLEGKAVELKEISPKNIDQAIDEENVTFFNFGRGADHWWFGLSGESGQKGFGTGKAQDKNARENFQGRIYYCRSLGFNCLMASSFFSQYPGLIYFSQQDQQSEVLAVYAAYFGKALKFSFSSPNGGKDEEIIAEDYSRFFGQRVMAGDFKPDSFYHGHAWWVGSGAKNPAPKFFRIGGGVAIDLTANLIRGSDEIFFQLMAGFSPRTIYGVISNKGSSIIFRYEDMGFEKKEKVVWESLKINSREQRILRAAFYRLESGIEGGRINFFLSSDGGRTWLPAKLNEAIHFSNGIGNDLRWKAEMYPSPDLFKSPWLQMVGVDHYY